MCLKAFVSFAVSGAKATSLSCTLTELLEVGHLMSPTPCCLCLFVSSFLISLGMAVSTNCIRPCFVWLQEGQRKTWEEMERWRDGG